MNRASLKTWGQRLALAGQGLGRRLKSPWRKDLYYVIEGQDWVIRREGEGVLGALAQRRPELKTHLTTSARFLRNQLVHFGSLGCLAGGLAHAHASNRIAATIYHGREGLDPGMTRNLETFIKGLPKLDAVITACSLMRQRLLDWGTPSDKLHLIPLGTSVTRFHPVSPEERLRLRRELGIPDDAYCVGSFQKDGNGWGEGLEPKLIKGPDVFVEVMAALRKRYPVFALLTGPARGYVKRGLKAAGAPYRHEFLRDFDQLPKYYNCLDLYLAAAREEGGPKCLPESMASGVPLVTTKAGMAPDMVVHGQNGMLAEVEDASALTEHCARLIEDASLRRSLARAGLETVRDYDWSVLAEAHFRLVYRPLLERP